MQQAKSKSEEKEDIIKLKQEISERIQPFNNHICHLLSISPITIFVYPDRVVSKIDPVFQVEIDKITAVRDDIIQSYLSKYKKY